MAFRAAWPLWTSMGASQTSLLMPCTASGRWREAVMVSMCQGGGALRLLGTEEACPKNPGTKRTGKGQVTHSPCCLQPWPLVPNLAVFECPCSYPVPAPCSVSGHSSLVDQGQRLSAWLWNFCSPWGRWLSPGHFSFVLLPRPQHHLHRRVLCQPGRLSAAMGWLYL